MVIVTVITVITVVVSGETAWVPFVRDLVSELIFTRFETDRVRAFIRYFRTPLIRSARTECVPPVLTNIILIRCKHVVYHPNGRASFATGIVTVYTCDPSVIILYFCARVCIVYRGSGERFNDSAVGRVLKPNLNLL